MKTLERRCGWIEKIDNFFFWGLEEPEKRSFLNIFAIFWFIPRNFIGKMVLSYFCERNMCNNRM